LKEELLALHSSILSLFCMVCFSRFAESTDEARENWTQAEPQAKHDTVTFEGNHCKQCTHVTNLANYGKHIELAETSSNLLNSTVALLLGYIFK
jgi:hypothetical protein